MFLLLATGIASAEKRPGQGVDDGTPLLCVARVRCRSISRAFPAQIRRRGKECHLALAY
jgi:hypothetical protein